MCRKHGREKKPAFDHFSRDLGVDPFLPQMWVARDSPAVKPVVPTGRQLGLGWQSLWPHSVLSECSVGLRQDATDQPTHS